MKQQAIKRETDLQLLSTWITEGSRVLDLGCGRGVFLEHLQRSKHCYAVGVDSNFEKILGCLKRGVSAYHGDIETILTHFPNNYFDWVVCSRTLEALEQPKKIIIEALRVGKRLAVGFINHGFWSNRLYMALHGQHIRNEVFPHTWQESRPSNPLSLEGFQAFCRNESLLITRQHFLSGDWRTPCRILPNLFAGYALFEVVQEETVDK